MVREVGFATLADSGVPLIASRWPDTTHRKADLPDLGAVSEFDSAVTVANSRPRTSAPTASATAVILRRTRSWTGRYGHCTTTPVARCLDREWPGVVQNFACRSKHIL